MKLYFDIDLISGPKYGMTRATLELMKSLKSRGVEVINFAVGSSRHLKTHKESMVNEGFEIRTCPIPRKIIKILSFCGLSVERFFLGKYDYYFQVGLHQYRTIPRQKYIIAIHDTPGLRFPGIEIPFPKDSQRIISQAGMIMTVSEFAESEIRHFFKVDNTKVMIIKNGCDLKFFNKKSKSEIEIVRDKYSLPLEYFVTYGGNSPRKNLSFLIENYTNIKLKNKPKLVMFGQKVATKSEDVIQLGYLDSERPAILSGAKALIFPSYYEGFGLPTLEAFACGTPVICSNLGALPEVSQGNALFFDPKDGADLQEKIVFAVNNRQVLDANAKLGLDIVKEYSWDEAAKKFTDHLLKT